MVTQTKRMVAGVVVVAALAAGGAGTARAQSFDVPAGFIIEDSTASATADQKPLVTVRPESGSFRDLSSVELSEVTAPIDDPDVWLQQRLSMDVSGGQETAENLFTSPDSPFSDPAFDSFRNLIPQVLRGVQTLSQLPLQFCEGPESAFNAEGELRELYCVFQLGPVHQYMVLRLQEVGDTWYYTEVRTMNERRLRHLIAIANSFDASTL